MGNFQSGGRGGSLVPPQPQPRTPLRLGIFGSGKLARAIEAEAARSGGSYQIAWMLHRDELPPGNVDAAIDASSAAAVADHLAWSMKTGTPLAIGTTGWNEPALEDLVSDACAVLVAPNFSPAVALLKQFAVRLAKFSSLDRESSLAIFEHHHGAKRDAPSGTAIAMAEAIIRSDAGYDRWETSPRSSPGEGNRLSGAIQIASLRSGHEIGFHEIIYDSPLEHMTISHRARDRRLFAAGALLACRWLIGKKGVFTMDDVVALDGNQGEIDA